MPGHHDENRWRIWVPLAWEETDARSWLAAMTDENLGCQQPWGRCRLGWLSDVVGNWVECIARRPRPTSASQVIGRSSRNAGDLCARRQSATRKHHGALLHGFGLLLARRACQGRSQSGRKDRPHLHGAGSGGVCHADPRECALCPPQVAQQASTRSVAWWQQPERSHTV
jgi:hypothetical protein